MNNLNMEFHPTNLKTNYLRKKCLILFFILFQITAQDIFSQCNFKNIGHRGGSSYYYPENTLLSIEQAYIEGAWACEVDVRYTKDSVMVLIHDDYVDRTTNGHGNVIEMTLSEIQNLDAGTWKDPKFAGEKIPTLIQAMQLAQQYNRKLYLNMKVYAPQMLSAALVQSGVPPDLIMIDPDELYKVTEYHTLMPNTPLVYFGAPPDPLTDSAFYNTLSVNNVIAIELFAGDILNMSNTWTSLYRDIIHSYGLELWAYTVNDNGYLHILKNFGIDGLETDRPAEAKNVFCYNQSGGFFPEKRITGQWDFINHNLDATIGSNLIERGDTSIPNQHAIFGTTADFGIPHLNGVVTDVMKTPAYDANHNLVFFSNIAPQGNPGCIFCDNDYTLIMDILKPASTQSYISIFQTSNNNSDDGDLFIRTADSTIGIAGTYLGIINDSVWYRLAAVFDLPEQTLNLYLNGIPLGSIPLINSLDGRFCINNNWGIQPSCLFSDDDGETSQLYVSSIQLRDYAMNINEIASLGEPTSMKIPAETLFSDSVCPVINDTISVLSVCEATNTLISINAGDTVNYRWQVNKGNGWTDISGIHYSQSADDSLHIFNADTSMNNYKYRCMISTDCYIFSPEISMIISPLPVLTAQPVDQNIYEGNNTDFYVSATGENLQFQWQADTGTGWYNLTDDLHYINTTSSILGVIQVSLNMDGYRFRCTVNGNCNNLISDSAILNINISNITLLNKNLISVFPNPNDGNFSITLNKNKSDEILTLFTSDGKKINLDIEKNSQFRNISLQVNSGIYILEYKSGTYSERSYISVIK